VTENMRSRPGKPEFGINTATDTAALFGPEVLPQDVCDVHVHTVPAEHVTGTPEATTAIIVCHGMGQQVKWETLEQFVHLLRPPSERAADPIDVQIVRLASGKDDKDDLHVGRVSANVTLDGEARRVHLYEAYWAPLTEGRVTLRDVMGFLTESGLDGLRHAREDFRRFIFNRCVKLPPACYIRRQIVMAMLVVVSLFAINAVIAGVAGSLFMSGRQAPFASAALRQWLTIDLLVYLAVITAWAVPMWLADRIRSRRRAADPSYVVPCRVQKALMAGAGVVAVATVLVAIAMASHAMAYHGSAAEAPLSRWWAVAFPIVWTIALGVNWKLRGVFVQYVGDVAAYLCAHRVSKFHEIRDQILDSSCKLATALYKLPYEKYIIVGHSLGSVVAYDTLNKVLVSEATGTIESVASRTAALITFGSPLDKTAYIFRAQQADGSGIRESLASAVQPLITLPRPKIGRWVNIYSGNDIISSGLSYYGAAIENRVDSQVGLPLLAHTQFWENSVLKDTILESIFGVRLESRLPEAERSGARADATRTRPRTAMGTPVGAFLPSR